MEKTLLYLGASVNLLPYLVYKMLGLGELKPATITLSLADNSVKIPKGIVEDVLVKVDKFYYLVDFVVLDTELVATGANYVPMILERPFLATSNAIINYKNGVIDESKTHRFLIHFSGMFLTILYLFLCQIVEYSPTLCFAGVI